MRIASILFTGIVLLGAGLMGPAACRAPKLSNVTAESVRVRSVVKKSTRRGGGGFFVTGGSGSRSGSSRYSSGGGFSSGK